MNSAPLIEWVAAREELRKRKEAGLPPPWTNDKILQTYRFCNIRRRDDRVSRWLRQHVLTGENLNKGFAAFIQFSAFCRWNNWPPVIAEIMKQGLYPAQTIDWKDVAHVVDQFKDEHKKAWTGAYMINAKGCAKGQSKAGFITSEVIDKGLGSALPQIEKALQTNSRREVWLALKEIRSFGDFMSGQIVDDWGYTILLSKAKDINTWVPQGPGSIRGFNRLMGLPLKARHKEEEWCLQLQAWRQEIIATLGQDYLDLSLMDCQNCLCETDKWLRVKNGEGRPRSKYKPETAYA